jgi:MerR family transcriptional regulator, light-induced transcriptional regulator
MTSSSLTADTRHTIADVERDTGLSKDTLRVWERRYGFPTPERDALGERQYDDTQLLRLRHIRRLLDAGHRPGGVVALPLEQLLQLGKQAVGKQVRTPIVQPTAARPGSVSAPAPTPTAGHALAAPVDHWMQLLRQHQTHELRQAMHQYLLMHGLAVLIRDGVTAMNARVGQSWLDGQLADSAAPSHGPGG